MTVFDRRRLFVCLVIFIIGFEITQAEGRLRRWTDVQGRKIEARLVAVSGANVVLERKDGAQFNYPLKNLGKRDQEYVKDNAPLDLGSASAEIDKFVWAGLKKANADIKKLKAELNNNPNLSEVDKRKEMARLNHMEIMTHPTPNLSDEKFLRRVYLDIAGRIPTYEEATTFLRDRSSGKRDQLIDDLIESEAFVSHFFNYMSDLLRVRDGISMGGLTNIKSQAYAEWVKDQIRNDKPWDKIVTELLAASGYLWENPATGYLITDMGMELCNLSNTFTTFAGTEITCAQCHDHPFEEVNQIDFYRMASFFGKLEYQTKPDPNLLKTLNKKKKEFADAAKKKEQNANGLNEWLDSYTINLGDGNNNKVALPFDYKGDHGAANQKVSPGVYLGDPVDIESAGGPRHAFAEWMTAENNPRFTINIVNRLWKHVFGVAQIEPVDNIPGHLEGQAQNYELLNYLERVMQEVDYSMKDFLKVLYKTRTYQREACYKSPTLAMIDRGEFHFPAPLLRRMSAEQLWDSFVAMSVDKPESPELQTRIIDEYREIMNADWKAMTYDQAMKLKSRYDNLGQSNSMMGNNNKGKKNGPTMIRASELPLPNKAGSFLYAFGQSDKKFIENSSKEGTIPQVMELLNGSLTNKILTADSRQMIQLAKSETMTDGLDVIFLSILSRKPAVGEHAHAEKLVREDDYSDLVWALLNTHEFMFIQ